tara:strand:+ start:388 stop:774 length:387 start_codon:yes stop_codon:yes gene_type:complete
VQGTFDHLPRDVVRGRIIEAGALHFAVGQGLLAYHTHDSRRSAPGFPDLVIVGTKRTIFREVKGERLTILRTKGSTDDDVRYRITEDKLTKPQSMWIAGLRDSGEDAAVWVAEQWLSGEILDEIRGLS